MRGGAHYFFLKFNLNPNDLLLLDGSTLCFSLGVFVGFFSVMYLLSPKFCHRFVGYLEEEAVVTYSKLLKVSVIEIYI